MTLHDPARRRQLAHAKQRLETLARNRAVANLRRMVGEKARLQAAEGWRKAKVAKTAKSEHQVHTDAKFDEGDRASFLFGVPTYCNSSWISLAKWDEGASELHLQVTESGNWYTFPGISYDAAKDFADYDSKGMWYWIEWREKYGVNSPVRLEPEDEPGRARRILG